MSEEQKYAWSEENVAMALGITKRELKTLRKERMIPVDHFEIVKGKHRYSKSGLLALCAFVKVEPPDGMDPHKKSPPAVTGDAEPIKFVVERLCPNPTWVLGRVVDSEKKEPVGDERIRCRVRNNLHLRFSQVITVVRDGECFREVRVRA